MDDMIRDVALRLEQIVPPIAMAIVAGCAFIIFIMLLGHVWHHVAQALG